jgi:RNA polymerase sigma-70 factor (ECF subfamily)
MASGAATPLDPYPDGLYGISESVGLGLVAGMQRLSARERAVIALTDVAGFGVAEAAEMLEATEGWVERTRRLARSALGAAPAESPGESPPQAGSEIERLLAERLQTGLEAGDRARIIPLLAEDVTLTCTRRWAVYPGRERVATILCERMDREGLWLVPTRANGQPAFGCYVPDPETRTSEARGLLTILLRGNRVGNLTRFWDNDVLPYFGLPDALTWRSAGTDARRASHGHRW